MKYYITGATGWLGINFLKFIFGKSREQWKLDVEKIILLIKNSDEKNIINNISKDVITREGDLSDIESLESFLVDGESSTLIHIAGIIHPKFTSEFKSINTEGTKKLLNICNKFNFKKVVLISSNSPCGCNKNNKVFDENSSYNPYLNYGLSKMNMEIYANKFHKDTGLDLSIIRAPWFYGPNQPERQKLFFEMIRNGKFPIVGDGNNLRSMVFVDNLIQGICLVIKETHSIGETYWIADENPYTMNQIVDTIQSIFKNEFGIEASKKQIKLLESGTK